MSQHLPYYAMLANVVGELQLKIPPLLCDRTALSGPLYIMMSATTYIQDSNAGRSQTT